MGLGCVLFPALQTRLSKLSKLSPSCVWLVIQGTAWDVACCDLLRTCVSTLVSTAERPRH